MPDHPVTLEDLRGRDFTTVPEIASILEYDERTIRAALERGEIPGVRVGQEWRVSVAWLRKAAGDAA